MRKIKLKLKTNLMVLNRQKEKVVMKEAQTRNELEQLEAKLVVEPHNLEHAELKRSLQNKLMEQV